MLMRLAASTFLVVAGASPGGWYPLLFVAFVPWLLELDRDKAKHRFLGTFSVGTAFMLAMAYWVMTAIHEFGELPWILCGIVWILFSAFNGGLPLVLFAWLRSRAQVHWPRRLQAAFPLFAAVLYVAVDFYFPKVFMNTWGQKLADSPWLRQLAALGGIALCTGFIWAVNEAVARAYGERKRSGGRLAAALPVGIVLLALVYGALREHLVRETMAKATRSVSVAVIQANIGNTLKKEAEKGQLQAWKEVVQDYLTRSEEALGRTPKPAVIVWPETAYPLIFTHPQKPEEQAIRRKLFDFVDREGVTLIFGGYDFNAQLNKVYNSLFALRPGADRERLSIYRKSRLMPFGDTVPGARYVPWIREIFPYLGLFGQGAGPDTLPIPTPSGEVRVAPLICYEAMFTDFTVEGGDLGASFFVNLTNDSWFGRYGEPYFHFESVVFRSIETGRPQLRATNTGISALIHADGSTGRRTGVYTSDLLLEQVPIAPPLDTLVMRWGDWVPGTSLLASVVVLALPWFARGLQRLRRLRKVQRA